MSKVILYGIKNCDTVKKARKWLEKNDVEYTFHDFRVDGLEAKQLKKWVKASGWEMLLNRRGTTWRQLPEKVRDKISEKSAVELMLANPTLIKRPVLENGKAIQVGFKESDYAALF